MGIKVGIVGTGGFAQCFIPLFIHHPLVDKVVLCDLDAKKLKENSKKHDIKDTSPSLDELLKTDIEAVAIMTQNWLHAPQATKALYAGKDVYSAVPAGITLEEITNLVDAVEKTGNIYMIGETSYYYPEAIYCRKKYKDGDFGKIVYGEGEYYHDWDHGLYDVMRARGGDDWKKYAASPPMHYPTHSTSFIISVTNAYMKSVSCIGFTDEHEDKLYSSGTNIWENKFSNQSALFNMSDGSAVRINEFRRIGHPGAVRMSLFGTDGCFEHNYTTANWLTKNHDEMQNINRLIKCSDEAPVDGYEKLRLADGTHSGLSPLHDVNRLPKSYRNLPNGHRGSHQFLIDDFVKACVNRSTPTNNVWDAARYMVPGLIAHESSLLGGALLEIPDFGTAKF